MKKGQGFQRVWWLVLITIGVIVASELPFMFLNQTDSNFLYMLCGECSLIIPAIVGVYMLSLEQSGAVLEGVGLRGFSLKLLPFVILLPVAAQNFSAYIAVPVQGLLMVLFGAQEYDGLVGGVAEFWQNFMIMCIFAPMLEEFICRGVLMQLLRRYGIASMLIYSSLGFALLHLSAQSIIPIFFLGLLLGIIRITTGSLFASMAAHAVSNLYALILLNAGDLNPVFEAVFVITAAVSFPVLLWYFLRNCDKGFAWRKELAPGRLPTGFSVGLVLAIVTFIITNVILLLGRIVNSGILYDIQMMY